MQSRCFDCKHIHDRTKLATPEGPLIFYCKAFPEKGGTGIPKEIIEGDFDHEKNEYPGDQGIRFENF